MISSIKKNLMFFNKKHLIDVEKLTVDEILHLCERAKFFENNVDVENKKLSEKTVAMMFCENSTRTRCSFELAAKRLGLNTINFDTSVSSLNKGESLVDTIENLAAMGVNGIIIRHQESGIIDYLIKNVTSQVVFINAGDGYHSHPTQALLDFYTIYKKFRTLENKKITIIGDILHSRVARSNIALFQKFGMEVNLCGPSYFKPCDIEKKGITWHNDIKSAVEDSDIIISLRLQAERHKTSIYPSINEYKNLYCLTGDIVDKYAKKDVVIMHPGPVNQDTDISYSLMKNPISDTILEQTQNGIYIRMAVLDTFLTKGLK